MNVITLKEDYGVEAKNIISLRDNVAVIENESDEKSILKKRRSAAENKWINDHRFNNELRIYKALSQNTFHYLNTPKLINYSEDFMILQFIEKKPHSKITVKDFVKAYIELQTIKVESNFKLDKINQFFRGFYYKGILISLFTISKHFTISERFKILSLFIKLNSRSKRLNNKYWLHGDITSNNIYHNIQDDKIYFLDFENLFYTRRWPLIEIIQRCVWLNKDINGFTVNNVYLTQYLKYANADVRKDIITLDLKLQYRFSLLMLCISIIAMAKGKYKRKHYRNLLKIVINSNKFDLWYAQHVEGDLIR